MRTRATTTGEVRRLLDLRGRGTPVRQIAAALGRHTSWVCRWLRRHGLLRPQPCRDPRKEAALRRLHARGLSTREMAERLGMSAGGTSSSDNTQNGK